MPTVALYQVHKSYGTRVAVDCLSLTLAPGCLFGLLGPNGSGKTSTLRMMLGMTLPDRGTVSLFGKPFHRDALRRVGYLPEERGLYRKMQVLEQLIFLGRLRGLDAATARARAVAWSERLQLGEALRKKTEDLSKGMQQKVQFIAALLHEPELILMDEPFSGLDPVNAQLLMEVLLDLRAQGRTVLFSTHRMDQVEKYCDAIALMANGRLLFSGSMREVKSRYPCNRVQMTFAGDDSFRHHPDVAEARMYAGMAELRLHDAGQAQRVLRHALDRGTDIRRFEVMEPTLEEIFIENVNASRRATAAQELVYA